ncbi:MAG: YraN family protein [Lachnospiraceae bacterium]|nr:YraN family protein [Lachnospiraceae bacterium]
MNQREKGSRMEQLACTYLEERGMRIVERNFRCSAGEIDVIGYHRGYLVFVEVKYRAGTRKGGALGAVDYRKQRRICKVADYYRYIHKVNDFAKIRYDVLAIQNEDITWIPNAFMHIYTRNM